jgi:hypothetical protein
MGNPNHRPSPSYHSPTYRRLLEAEKNAKQKVNGQREARAKNDVHPYGLMPLPPADNGSHPSRETSGLKHNQDTAQAPTVQFNFMNLFSEDPAKDAQLRKIRDRIFYFSWARNRDDWAYADFIVSEYEVIRNVAGKKPWRSNDSQTLALDAKDSLMFVKNKAFHAAFIEFIYGINTLDIEVNIKPHPTEDTITEQEALIRNLCANPHFRRYTKMVNVDVHWPAPSEYPRSTIPSANLAALISIVEELRRFTAIERCRVTIYCHGLRPDKFQVTYSAIPFYDLNFSTWLIYVKNNGRHYRLPGVWIRVCNTARYRFLCGHPLDDSRLNVVDDEDEGESTGSTAAAAAAAAAAAGGKANAEKGKHGGSGDLVDVNHMSKHNRAIRYRFDWNPTGIVGTVKRKERPGEVTKANEKESKGVRKRVKG